MKLFKQIYKKFIYKKFINVFMFSFFIAFGASSYSMYSMQDRKSMVHFPPFKSLCKVLDIKSSSGFIPGFTLNPFAALSTCFTGLFKSGANYLSDITYKVGAKKLKKACTWAGEKIPDSLNRQNLLKAYSCILRASKELNSACSISRANNGLRQNREYFTKTKDLAKEATLKTAETLKKAKEYCAEKAVNTAEAAVSRFMSICINTLNDEEKRQVLKDFIEDFIKNSGTDLFNILAAIFSEDGAGAKFLNEFLESIIKAAKDKFQGGTGTEFIDAFIESVTKAAKDKFKHGTGAEFINAFIEALNKSAKDKFKDFIDHAKKPVNEFVNEAIGENITKRYNKAVWLTAGSATGVIASWYGFRTTSNQIDRILNKPRLIIESSFDSPFNKVKSILYPKNIEYHQMIFPRDLETRLNSIIKSTKIISSQIKKGKTNVKYRNLLLYGPPGTGKTLFSKELAKRSGMHYALISGASFSKFKDGEGIVAMDELFSWANKSKEGFILIIDEADSLLYDRKKMEPNSKEYQILNNFLNYTGERSNKWMIVMCANHKDYLDEAMESRIDDYVEIPLPTQVERAKVLALYRNKILLDEAQNGKAFVDSVNDFLNDTKINQIASVTQNLSNRDLEGIINIIKTDADVTENGLVTERIIDIVVQRVIEKHHALSNKEAIAS